VRFKRLYKLFRPPRGFRLTKAGRVFFVFMFAIIVVAMITGNNLLFLILAFMLAFMIVSGVESERNLRHLEIDRIIQTEIFAGITARMGYHIKNSRNDSVRLIVRELGKINVESLPKGSGEVVFTEYTFLKRGKIGLGEIKIFTSFPYGLFEKSIRFDANEDIFVFPKPLAVMSTASSGLEGIGEGRAADSISHIRPYVPGDPGSKIVWKKLHLGLFSRVVEGGSGLKGVVVISPGGNLEEKLSKATYLIIELFAKGVQFGLAVGSYYSGLAASRAHKIEILKRLAVIERIGEPPDESLYGDAARIYI
jgi:uncharacterized protein (DUF58 family)